MKAEIIEFIKENYFLIFCSLSSLLLFLAFLFSPKF